MQTSAKSLWIFVVVALVVLGLFALAMLTGLLSAKQERAETSFQVGPTPSLEISNFSGRVKVEAGQDGIIQVVAVKRAASQSKLQQIKVDWRQQDGRVVIKTEKPSGFGSAWVEFQITAPASTSLVADTGSGGIDVRGLSGPITVDTGSGGVDLRDVAGEIRAQTGSGGIDVSGAAGPVRLETGSGGIDYEGDPKGECRFQTGSGGIDLVLPDDLNATVDLSTGSGGVKVDFEVTGTQTRNHVRGTIGTGDGATIYAQTGSGSIDLKKQ